MFTNPVGQFCAVNDYSAVQLYSSYAAVTAHCRKAAVVSGTYTAGILNIANIKTDKHHAWGVFKSDPRLSPRQGLCILFEAELVTTD